MESLKNTGPLRWEYDLGKPPIPFVGIPFCIIGNTHYQCFYASPDIRTLRNKQRKEEIGVQHQQQQKHNDDEEDDSGNIFRVR